MQNLNLQELYDYNNNNNNVNNNINAYKNQSNSLFSELYIDDDVDHFKKTGNHNTHTTTYTSSFSEMNESMKVISKIRENTQTRYMVVLVVILIAEIFRSDAHTALKDKNYLRMTTAFESAYQALNSCLIETDPWFAILLTEEIPEQNQLLSLHQHNKNHLLHVMDFLNLVSDDTEIKRNHALQQLQKELLKIEKELNPLRHDRDIVKARIGIEKWTSNLNPKKDYVAMRKELEIEERQLKKAIAILMELRLFLSRI